MGLAEPKRRKKLTPSNHGPSAWSKAAPNSSVGFKLMASMGWAPGKGLGNDLQGEKDNIKYSLKDDLLGIGAKKEYGGGVWRGMGEVDDLYRRLDVGGSPKPPVEEVTEVTEIKEEIKLRGGWKMNFQVGDTYRSSFSREESEVEVATSTPKSSEDNSDSTSEKSSKKRKRDDEGSEKKRSKKEKKEDKSKRSKKDKTDNADTSEKVKKSKSSKTKKDVLEKDGDQSSRESKAESSTVSDTDASVVVNGTNDSTKKTKDRKNKSIKKEKSSAKEKKVKEKSVKKEKKEKRKKTKTVSSDNVSSVTDRPSTIIAVSTRTETTVSAPSETDRSSPVPRHMHRSRYLAMKRASVMNPDALREILGVKG